MAAGPQSPKPGCRRRQSSNMAHTAHRRGQQGGALGLTCAADWKDRASDSSSAGCSVGSATWISAWLSSRLCSSVFFRVCSLDTSLDRRRLASASELRSASALRSASSSSPILAACDMDRHRSRSHSPHICKQVKPTCLRMMLSRSSRASPHVLAWGTGDRHAQASEDPPGASTHLKPERTIQQLLRKLDLVLGRRGQAGQELREEDKGHSQDLSQHWGACRLISSTIRHSSHRYDGIYIQSAAAGMEPCPISCTRLGGEVFIHLWD